MENLPHPLAPPPWGDGRPKSGLATRLALFAKILVSAALIIFLSRKLDWDVVGSRLAAAKPSPLIGGVMLMVGTIVCAAWRWRLLVRHADAPLGMVMAVQLTFAGMFFGQVLPATVGGDVVRGVLACRTGLPWRGVVSGIVLDRITALLASIILIFAGLPWLAARAVGTSAPLLWTGLASGALIVLIAVALTLDRIPLPHWLARQSWLVSMQALVGQIRRGLASKSGVAALAISLVIHLTTVAIVILIGQSLGITIPLLAGFLVVPLAIFAAAVPVSLNGWGIREGVMVTGFALFGIGAGDALLVSVILGVSVIISVLPGSLTWVTLQ